MIRRGKNDKIQLNFWTSRYFSLVIMENFKIFSSIWINLYLLRSIACFIDLYAVNIWIKNFVHYCLAGITLKFTGKPYPYSLYLCSCCHVCNSNVINGYKLKPEQRSFVDILMKNVSFSFGSKLHPMLMISLWMKGRTV